MVSLALEFLASTGPGRYVCPKCSGGSDSERSLSIRLDEAGGIHWRCFRSTCGYTGGPRGVRSIFAEPKREPRIYTRPTVSLSQNQKLWGLIRDRFDISPYELEGYSEYDDRFILGVYGPRGYNKRGVIAYSLSGAKPKSLTYNEKPDEPFIHYASGAIRIPGALVVVEDWFSAEKVAATGRATGVAIQGTHLGQAEISEIASVASEWGCKTWLALDRDAYAKSLVYQGRFREQFPNGLGVWSLRVDLKYETPERIRAALLDGEVDFQNDRAELAGGYVGGSQGI